MTEDPQGIKSSFNERMRLIRFRRKKENLRFWQEFKLVPRWLIWTVVVFAPELKDQPALASLALFGIVTAVSLIFTIIVFMTGYVNKDAKRRGMHSGLWTFLVLVLMPGYFVLGFIIYLLMREPLPYNCPQCGATVGARFNFCPNCKCNLHPSCPNCKREVAETDKYCAYCGYDVEPAKTSESRESPGVPR